MRLAYVLIPWNIGYWFDFVFHYLRISYSLYIVIFFNEYLILKYYIEFIWKRVPPLDHDFTSTCLNILNSFMSLVFGIIEIICSFEIDTLEYEKMTGPIAYRSKMMMQKSRYLLNTFICTTCTWMVQFTCIICKFFTQNPFSGLLTSYALVHHFYS